MTTQIDVRWLDGVRLNYPKIYRPRILRGIERYHIFFMDMRYMVVTNDSELLSEIVTGEMMGVYKEHLRYTKINFLEELERLIDLAIQAESHECYILLVEYKQSHNLYQDNPFEL